MCEVGLLQFTAHYINILFQFLAGLSSGPHRIPRFVAKTCVYSYPTPLTYFINKYFTDGIVPVELKLARVVPILKAGDPSQIAYYRPIYVLTYFSEVFEKIMYNCILKLMNDNPFLYEHQYGFRQKHSTHQSIITLVDKITTFFDKGDIIISVFLDRKQTFDTVDHHILLKKLYAYGIRGHIIKWVESYLCERSQSFIMMNILRPILLNVVFHKDQYWVPYCLLYT